MARATHLALLGALAFLLSGASADNPTAPAAPAPAPVKATDAEEAWCSCLPSAPETACRAAGCMFVAGSGKDGRGKCQGCAPCGAVGLPQFRSQAACQAANAGPASNTVGGPTDKGQPKGGEKGAGEKGSDARHGPAEKDAPGRGGGYAKPGDKDSVAMLRPAGSGFGAAGGAASGPSDKQPVAGARRDDGKDRKDGKEGGHGDPSSASGASAKDAGKDTGHHGSMDDDAHGGRGGPQASAAFKPANCTGSSSATPGCDRGSAPPAGTGARAAAAPAPSVSTANQINTTATPSPLTSNTSTAATNTTKGDSGATSIAGRRLLF